MNIHFIQHEVFEAPGAYLDWAMTRGYHATFSKIYDNQLLPETADHLDVLIILGGPQNPSTTQKECPHFNAKAETDLIQKAINGGKVVVGVCLGSQLIGEALGASYSHSPEKEIGVFPIELTEEGLGDEKLSHFGQTLSVGHWHNDMPGLTAQSKILATSKGCPRQIVAYSDLVYGFQCHMELTPEVVEQLIASDEELVLKSSQYKFVQSPDEIRSFDYREMNAKLFIFLDQLVKIYHKSAM
ncbi:type 1 glutamine amidotransferase [Chryseobacterium sp. MYb328]|uniref:type 1 glutamine amidotransferase n=1 Tax=Chryseobacterium sp. MYb328 TaxID=2745231 RepID=UPI0030951971